MAANLDKTKPFTVLMYRTDKARYKQGDVLYNCGGYPIVDGEPVGVPVSAYEVRHDNTFNPYKTAKQASDDAARMIAERDARWAENPPWEVKEESPLACTKCGKQYKDNYWLTKHMETCNV
jgi:hypothetical protein